MARLSALKAEKLSEPGRYSDGDGLLLVVGLSGSKSWIARLQAQGKRRDIGLGSYKDVSLREAREKLSEVRKQLRSGVDPVAARRREQTLAVTFRKAAEAYIAEQQPTWRSGKHAGQWTATLSAYAYPTLGDLPITQVTAPLIRETMLPIWNEKAETASRVLQRIGAVLDWACASGLRESGSPTDAVRKGLPRRTATVEHHSAMPYTDLPALMRSLCNAPLSVGRLALRALILTACRSGEIRGARWSELDLDKGLWTIPAERMKTKRPHVAAIPARVALVFEAARPLRRGDCDLVFPGTKSGKPLSDMTLTKLLRDAKLDYAVHGFRSAFRDWAAEKTSFPGEVAEAALSHTNKNRVEAAYRRTDFLEKRFELMEAWTEHCFSYQQR